jgi:hypothetical protein
MHSFKECLPAAILESMCYFDCINIGGKFLGFGPLANYADRATAACWRSSANFCGQRVLRGQRNGSPRSLV